MLKPIEECHTMGVLNITPNSFSDGGKYLEKSGKTLWRIVERKKKSTYYDGVGSNSLHDFRWGKIK